MSSGSSAHTPGDAAFEAAKALFLDGLAALQGGRLAAAEAAFLGSLERMPGRVSTLVNLAATRLALRRPADALVNADAVLALEPANLDALFHRGSALAELGRHGPALEAFRAVCRLDPQRAEAWSHAGAVLRETGRLAEAAQAFEQAIAHGADPQLHRYYLASVRGADAAASPSLFPSSAPAHYVQALFDAYADEFDAHLVEVLGYSAHTTLVEHLPFPAAGRFASGLDLGCGTGLCGTLLADRVGRLTGVDLSAGMLARAAATGRYAQLLQTDLVDHLRSTEEHHDLVLAADVFIYVGDLAPVFEAVARVIAPGGMFCFSVEAASREPLDFELLPSLRYAHSQRYVAALAARHGFATVRQVDAPIREEQRVPIAGRYVYLRRGASTPQD